MLLVDKWCRVDANGCDYRVNPSTQLLNNPLIMLLLTNSIPTRNPTAPWAPLTSRVQVQRTRVSHLVLHNSIRLLRSTHLQGSRRNSSRQVFLGSHFSPMELRLHLYLSHSSSSNLQEHIRLRRPRHHFPLEAAVCRQRLIFRNALLSVRLK